MSELFELITDANGVARLTLNRPEVHNAFNAELIAALSERFDALAAEAPRVLVLTGSGRSFSAGADLDWMRSMAEAGETANREDALRLAGMFRKLDELPCPTIARINGPAFGGGVGLISCCDIAIAAEHATFGLTEVRLGLIPATIAPFVIERIGMRNARRYMLTGERFDATQAQRIGLIHECCEREELDSAFKRVVDGLLAGGPIAVAEAKRLVRSVGRNDQDSAGLDESTAEWIARMRVGAEGQEGLQAFLQKRRPAWTQLDRDPSDEESGR